MMTDLHFLDMLALSERIRTRDVSVLDIVESQLERIGRLDPQLQAFVLLTGEAARQRARDADTEIRAGLWRGPLHGVPVAIKDLFWMKGPADEGGHGDRSRRARDGKRDRCCQT